MSDVHATFAIPEQELPASTVDALIPVTIVTTDAELAVAIAAEPILAAVIAAEPILTATVGDEQTAATVDAEPEISVEVDG
jgi:hypothetical protein